MTPKQRADLISTATRREAERNRSARSPKDTHPMNQQDEPKGNTALFVICLIIGAVIASGIWQIGGKS